MNPAREKVELEGVCRSCGERNVERLDAAHLWPRSMGGRGFEDPDRIIPLCSLIKGGIGCHDDFDAHRLDVLDVLTVEEQAALVRDAQGIERARVRVLPSEYLDRRAGRIRAVSDPDPFAS